MTLKKVRLGQNFKEISALCRQITMYGRPLNILTCAESNTDNNKTHSQTTATATAYSQWIINCKMDEAAK